MTDDKQKKLNKAWYSAWEAQDEAWKAYKKLTNEDINADEEFCKEREVRRKKIAVAKEAWNKARDKCIEATVAAEEGERDAMNPTLRILCDAYFSHIGFHADTSIVRGNTVFENFGKEFYAERLAERIDAVFNQYPHHLPKRIRELRKNYDIYRHPVCLLYYVFVREAAWWKYPQALPFSADFTKADLAFSDLGVSYNGAMGEDR